MIRNRSQAIRTALILVASILLVVVVTWFVPSLTAASLNVLFRLRGELKVPDDVVIVAIDDESLQRVGQWPWPRSVIAGVLDTLTSAQARGVGLDVIYAEPSAPEEDHRLVAAIARNGRVVLPAQLYEAASKENSGNLTTDWLRPLPAFAAAARAVGHAHVSLGVDGMARSIQLSKADDRADRLWAFSLEVVRVAERIPAEDLEEQPGLLRFGPYRIPVYDEAVNSATPGVAIIRQNETAINFAGPTRSFLYYSIADVIGGKIPPSVFSDKIVLIGAASQSMGDTRVAPFMHYSADHRQGGQEMPGVEIHANIINTIRGRLSFHSLPEWAAFVAALVVILSSALAIRWLDGWRQIAVLGLVLLAITAGSFIAFSRYQLIPPLVPMLTGFVAVIPLLLNRSLAASRELDIKLAALVSSQKGFLLPDAGGAGDFIDHEQGLDLPQSLAWKLRAVDDLTTRLLARMSFINRILSSMGEGVLVADLQGRVVFANREAAQLLDCGQAELAGAQFADLLVERGRLDESKLREAIRNATGGPQLQIEFEIPAAEPRYYLLLLSALVTDADAAPAVTSEKDALVLPPAGNMIGLVALITDITRRVELDRMKTETLQLVSHELRTPLTSIQGLSDVLLKFPVATEESREMLSTIHSEAVRLGETINRYLDLTRLESGAQPLNLTPVSCQQLIAGCVRNLSLLAAERRISLTSRINPAVPVLHADAQLLTQAVNNLLSNAIKYSPPDTEVVITAEPNHTGVRISVRDQGRGIPEEAREKIFEKFYRLERDAASGIVGTGLGLPLVKEIVEQHGGRITVESAPATGSTFTIHLPLRQPALAVAGR
ncbi:MAG TPA: CHASE2 domain-containing protein [Blastocatellia bacterium]|nr:CHASE2 domain-containing protein [Blastocatellia bacterium]